MGGEKLNKLDGLSQRGLHSVFDMFEDMSYEEAMQYASMDDGSEQDQSEEDIGAAQDDDSEFKEPNDWFEAFFNKTDFKARSDIEKAIHRVSAHHKRPYYVKKTGKAERAAK